jgi:PAS domain S-box-containing protein
VTFAALVQYALLPRPSIAPFVFFYFSIALVAWSAGPGPGLLAVVLSAVIANVFFMTPHGQLSLSGPDLTASLLFVVGAGAVALLCAEFRKSLLEQREVARALRESEEKLRLAKDAAKMGAWDWNIVTGELVWSERCKALYDLGPDTAMTYQVFLGAIHAEDRARIDRVVKEALTGRTEYDAEMRVPWSDGSVHWVASKGRAFYDAAGQPVRMAGMALDVTQRKLAEEALRESEIKYRTLFDSIDEGFCVVEVLFDASRRPIDYRFVEVNRAFEWQTGLSNATGKRMRELVPSHEEYWFQTYGRVALTGEPTRFANRAEALGRWYDVYAFRIGAPEARTVAVIFDDITERKNSEAALRDADQRKSEFLGVLSHELRNPLAPIQNSLYIATRAPPGSEQARRALAVIERQVRQLTRLVDDLLDVTRIARGKVRLQLQRVDLQALARQTGEDHQDLFKKNGLQLEVVLADEPLFVNADPTRLTQVIGNLLHNAAKFTPRGSRTTLSLRRADERSAEISVQDRGQGIDPDVLPKLFEPFVQAEKTLARNTGGLGLGLALVKGLVEMHGGSVSAHSAGRGRGATFVVRIPVERRKTPRLALVAEPTAPLPARRILVIEDNVDAAETTREALELNGHAVELAYTGPEGIEKARAFKPDVVLCDIGLPGMNGFEVAKAMRLDPDLGSATLIALSGYALPEDVDRAKAAGFDLHLAKPPDLAALERSITEARGKVEPAGQSSVVR